MKPLCIDCLTEFNPKRLELGYRTCLDCGSTRALKEIKRKAKCSAPAYNKGAYQYVGTKQAALGVGK
jgi:ferredoxin-like protein FixX